MKIFRLIRLNFSMCVCVCKSLSLSISSTTFSISLFLRYCYFSVSNLLAIFNRSHHHHHQKKKTIITIEIQLSWNDPIFLSHSFLALLFFHLHHYFFYLIYYHDDGGSYLYIISTLNQLKRKNNKTVRNISSIILMTTSTTTTTTMMKDFVVHFLWCIQWNSFNVLQTMKEKPKNYNIYCRMSSRSLYNLTCIKFRTIWKEKKYMLLLID